MRNWACYDDAHWLAKLAEEPLILVMPLARFEQRLTIGLAEPEWQSWATMAKP
jgi:hypothetical protein